MLSNMNSIDTPDFSVDVIIAVRSRDEYDVIERLRWRTTYRLPGNIRFLVVDYGSSPEESAKISEVCRNGGFTYIYVDARGEIWNASEARNAAILESTAEYLLFEDVDLVNHVDFYNWLNIQIKSLIIKGGWPFIVAPVSYLTQEAAESFSGAAFDDETYADLTTEINDPDSTVIEFHAPVSSYMLCRRQDVISIGGHDPAFEGWGLEDSDFALKLLRATETQKPREFYRLDTRKYSDQVQWRGWRALFRVYGDLLANKGIYSFHIWHPIASHRSVAVRERNLKIFKHNSQLYGDQKFTPTPLWNSKKPTHLFLGKNPHSFNTAVFEVFNNPLLIEEHDIEPRNVGELIEKYSIESIIFNNPYATPRRQAIYEKCKELGVATYVVERGALPWSIYIDRHGFCAESTAYQESNWPVELSDERRANTIDYISSLKIEGVALEPQSNMIGGKNLKRTLFGESIETKILFVAMQSPSDTTTNFFCGQIKTYQDFVNEVRLLPEFLGPEWRVVYKNHPLTLDKEKFAGAVNVDDYHIGDILEMADAVTLINSGVGVLSAAYGKPVFYFGEAFYACDGLNAHVASAMDLAGKISEFKTVDSEKMIRFFSYLIHDFYSFAKWERKERKHTDKAKLSISENIKYEVVRVPGRAESIVRSRKIVDLQRSMLFDRYRLDEYMSRQAPVSRSAVNAASEKSAVPIVVARTEIRPKTQGSAFGRKWRKLVRDPKLFIADALLKRRASQ